MMDSKLISIVIPCYNEEENIERTYAEIKKITSQDYNFEFIFVDNASTDRSPEILRRLVESSSDVAALLLSRNFGAEASSLAGFEHARGKAVITLAADLQDPPELISEFIKKWEAGYDIVLGQTHSTSEGFFMKRTRRLFYRILKKLSYIDIPEGVTGFGLIDRRVNEELNKMPERNRFYRGLLAWAGFKRALIPYTRQERKFGRSSYSFFNYLKHAESGLFAFSNLPLDFLTYFGIFLVGISIFIMIVYVVTVLSIGNPIAGSATLFLGIMFFGGIQILAISILGKYIAVIFEETKNRPRYIVKEVVRSKKDENVVA